MPEWCQGPETKTAVEAVLPERRKARREVKTDRNPAKWKILLVACKAVRTEVDDGLYAHLEKYVARLESFLEDRDSAGCTNTLRGP